MKPHLFATLLLGMAASAVGLKARALPIDSLFTAMPAAVCPLLSDEHRLDLIDLYNGRRPAEVDNIEGERTTLRHKTADCVQLQLTAATEWTLKLFPAPADTLLMVCLTYHTPPFAESTVAWYDGHWQPQPAPAGFVFPEATAFAAGSDSLRQAIVRWPARFISASPDTETPIVRFTLAPLTSSSVADSATARKLCPIALRWEAAERKFVNCPVQN